MKPSKLWRTFGATQDLFELSSDQGLSQTYRDDSIISISIEAGSTMTGLSTSAATVELRGHVAVTYENDRPARLDLSYYGRHLIGDLVGKPGDLLRDRFRGRIAGQKVTDNGHGKRDTTTLTLQDWAAFISQLERGGYGQRDDPSVARLYQSMFIHSGVPGSPQLQHWGSTWHWIKWPEDEQHQPRLLFSTSDIVGKFSADLGIFIRQSRNGVPHAHSHDHLQYVAEQWATPHPHPLQRSQVVKPVEWSRSVSIPLEMKWKQHPAIGNHGVVTWTFPPPNGMVYRTEEVDLTHVWDISANPDPPATGFADVMRARIYRSTESDMSVETVTVDVLAMVKRNQGTDRALIGQLLAMDHGDPIALSYDWPGQVRGVYFAERIAHKITHNEWTITLDLLPARHVTGVPSPSDIAGRTWDTRYLARAWNQEGAQWNQA